MKKIPWIVLIFLVFVVGSFIWIGNIVTHFGQGEIDKKVSKNSILMLEMKGVIMDGKKFLKSLAKYREDDNIKAIVIQMDSPGGVVGPSQEIYAAIKKVREEYKKPVVVVSTGLMASGAYYAAVAADKIVVAPGTMMGSIGVIMEFANLEKLYDWANISRYTITSGKFKDSGAEYRAMRDDERELFQSMINDVYAQFRTAVKEGRKLSDEVMDQYADGRVFTGQQGVQNGFADQVGMTEDAVQVAADLAGLGKDFEIFEPPKKRPSFFEMLMSADEEDEDATVLFKNSTERTIKKLLKVELAGKPLYMMPGTWE